MRRHLIAFAGLLACATQASAVLYLGTPPGNVAAQAFIKSNTGSTVYVSWTDASTSEINFQVEWRQPGGTTADFEAHRFALQPANTTSFVTPQMAYGSYEMRVCALYSLSSGCSSPVTVKLAPPPAAPTNLSATRASASAVTLNWANAANGAAYNLVYWKPSGATVWSGPITASGTATSQTVTLPDAGSYDFQVMASSADGVSLTPATVSFNLTVNTVQTILEDMLLPPVSLPLASNGFGGTAQPFIFGRYTAAGMNSANTAALRDFVIGLNGATETRLDSTDGTWRGWNNIAPWFWVFPGEDNTATNTQIEIRNYEIEVMLDTQPGKWIRITGDMAHPNPSFSQINYSYQTATATLTDQDPIHNPPQQPVLTASDSLYTWTGDPSVSRKIRPYIDANRNGKVFEMWPPCVLCNSTDFSSYADFAGHVTAVFVSTQARMVPIDGTKSETGKATFYAQQGFDFRQVGDWNPGEARSFASGPNGRMKQVTSQWQSFNVLAVQSFAQNSWERYTSSYGGKFDNLKYLVPVNCLPANIYVAYPQVNAHQCAAGEAPLSAVPLLK